jgi:hypothetical protein
MGFEIGPRKDWRSGRDGVVWVRLEISREFVGCAAVIGC